MKVPLAWRILTDDKRRTALALIGIFMAILLVFVELGFFYAVPRGGLLLYDNMRFDLLLASSNYEYQAQPGVFPLSQLEKLMARACSRRRSTCIFTWIRGLQVRVTGKPVSLKCALRARAVCADS